MRKTAKKNNITDIDLSLIKTIYDNTENAVMALDKNGIILTASSAIEKLNGYVTGKIIGKKFNSFIHPDHHKYWKDIVNKANNNPGISISPVQIDIRHENNSWVRVEASVKSPKDKNIISIIINFRNIEEKNKLEEELRKSEKLYRDVAENMNDLICILDPADSRCIYVSPSVTRLLGYTPEEFISLGEKLMTPESLKLTNEYYKMVHEKSMAGRPVEQLKLEIESYKKDGSTIWFETSYSFTLDKSGKLSRIMGINRDITERKKLEDDLRKNEELYRMITENSSDAIWTMLLYQDELHGRPAGYLSPAIKQFLGYTPEEFLSLPFEKTHAEDSENIIDRNKRQIMELGKLGIRNESIRYEESLISKYGSIVHIEQTIKPMYNADGVFIGIQGVMHDITERKKLENALRKSEEQYRMLAENMNDVLTVTDFEGKMIYISPSIEQQTGYTPEEWIIKNLEESHSKRDADFLREKINNAINYAKKNKTGIEERFELVTQHKDGHDVYLEFISGGMYNANGELIALQGVSRDITERKKLEESLRKSEEQYRLLAENMSDFVWILDADTLTHTYISPSIERITGYTREEFTRMKPEETLVPESWELKKIIFGKALSAAKAGLSVDNPAFEVQTIRKDGSKIWFETKFNIICDSSGRPVSIQGANRDITERKKVEENLRINEMHLNEAMNMAQIAYFQVDDNEDEFIFNDRYYELLKTDAVKEGGYRKRIEDFIETFTPDDKRRFKQRRKIFGKPDEIQVFSIEEILRRRDGENRNFITQVKHIADKSGRSLGIFGITQDITERKRLEDSLRKSEEQYRLLAENISDIIWLVDIETDGEKKSIHKYISPSIKRITGYTTEEWSNMPPEKMHSMEDAELIKNTTKKIIDSHYHGNKEKTERIEVSAVTKGGSTVNLEIIIGGFYNNEGIFAGVQGVTRDITERRKLEEALRKSERYYRMLAENSNDVIWVIEFNLLNPGQITKPAYISPSIKRLTGYTPEEWNNIPFEKKHPAESEDLMNEKINLVINSNKQGTKKVERFEIKDICKNGSIIDVEIIISGLYNEKNEFIGIQGVTRDITERKRAEKELARSNADLEQFAYIASHDLQEPLRMVASFTELLARRYKGKLDKDAEEFIDFAVSGANRMKQLINDLLAYSRIGTKSKPFAITDCRKIFDNAISNLSIAITENNAIVKAGPLPTLKADDVQLTQLFQNLIANAIKFRSAENPRVNVSATKIGEEWMFSINDNGIGISSQYFDRIFIIFQRVHGKKDYPGTGIGLAICKKIVERHGGHIWVESDVGKGSTFYFTISQIRGD